MIGQIYKRIFSKLGKGDTGVTMIELLVVIIILGIMASIAIPSFSVWLPNYRLKSAARDLYSNLQLTKLGAVKQNKSWAIVFDQGVTPGRYYIVSDQGVNGAWDTASPPGDDTVEKTVDLINYDGIDFGHAGLSSGIGGHLFTPASDDVVSGANDIVEFTSRGTCNVAGYAYFENQKNTTYGVGSRASGVILLRKWSGTAWE